MVGIFYKPEYKVHIFKGDDMYNEEFLAALDSSPTHCRTAQELERMQSIIASSAASEKSVSDSDIEETEGNDQE